MSSDAYELTETVENYLKEIYRLIDTSNDKGARISDIASAMDRSLSTVTGAVQRMANDGLLHYERYGKVTMTEKGLQLAESVNKNYDVIKGLLILLGIPEDNAILDACSMEHQISPTTISTIQQFIEFSSKNENAKELLEQFKAKA